MTKDEFKKLEVGDVVKITFQGKNYGKLGTVREIHLHHSGVVCLEPLNCQFDVPEGYKLEQNKDGFYYFRHSGISYRIEDSKKDIYGTWIPVSERLPEALTYDWVLIQCKMVPENYYGVPHIGELRHGVWYSDCYEEPLEEMISVKVTHWCPLPNIPE